MPFPRTRTSSGFFFFYYYYFLVFFWLWFAVNVRAGAKVPPSGFYRIFTEFSGFFFCSLSLSLFSCSLERRVEGRGATPPAQGLEPPVAERFFFFKYFSFILCVCVCVCVVIFFYFFLLIPGPRTDRFISFLSIKEYLTHRKKLGRNCHSLKKKKTNQVDNKTRNKNVSKTSKK